MANSKPMCGLWHANVEISQHNSNGACRCLRCMGGGCHTCGTYEKLAAEIDFMAEYTRCQLCQGYDKTR